MLKNNFNIILFNPQIPPNTGNIIRLSSITSCSLYLIKPLGFEMTNKKLKRAGLDYGQNVEIQIFDTFHQCYEKLNSTSFYFITKFGKIKYSDIDYKVGDSFVFGSEINGISDEIINHYKKIPKLYIPMVKGNRSINLSNAVSICIYEAWRQIDFN